MARELMLVRTEDLLLNPTNRVPIALCLDASGSMAGAPMDELNQGVRVFFDALQADPIAKASAEVALVTFADRAETAVDFQGLERISQPPVMTSTGGLTSLGEGVNLALDLLETRKDEYQNAGVDYFQPWLVLMTDAQPTDISNAQQAGQRACDMEGQGKLVVINIGIGTSADMNTLAMFSKKHKPFSLQGLKFRECFQWLSKSVIRVSQSRPGEKMDWDYKGIKGWGTLD
ncbi:MAG: VWA domain-containing protein [Gemmataceae bacterium]|nr:VWA domain-containing protein [Gemmataceae bacterium]